MQMLNSRFNRTSYTVSRDEVFAVPTPPSTLTHKPIHHSQLLSETESLIDKITNLTIEDEVHILSKTKVKKKGTDDIQIVNANEYLGLLKLSNSDTDKTYQVMLINSHVKTRAATLILYKTIKICTNGMFLIGGKENIHKRKHTQKILTDLDNNLTNTITDFITSIESNIEYDNDVIEDFKQTPLDVKDKDHFLMESIRNKIINPARVKQIDDEIYNPSTNHQHKKEQTIYDLLMAYTHIFKGIEPFRRVKLLSKLNKQFTEMLVPNSID